jgi:2-dehydro-3-deoxyphosphogluconate aldolase/(4S)-4-hydroxy-2-oxoglutarate aldolase
MHRQISPDKAEVIARIKAERAVAVIRTDSVERALRTADAAVAGGFSAIEITFSFPNAARAIENLATINARDLLIGAGTILTREQVLQAVAVGARFLVSPCVLPEVINAARELQVAVIPGALT